MGNFQITALEASEFSELFVLDDEALKKIGARRMVADKRPGFPCRISLQDAALGEEVILLTYQHHQTSSPYQASGPIFIRQNVTTAQLGVNEIPAIPAYRLLSVRSYDHKGMMKDACVTDSNELRDVLALTFDKTDIEYVHIHNAKPGCFNCKATRI